MNSNGEQPGCTAIASQPAAPPVGGCPGGPDDVVGARDGLPGSVHHRCGRRRDAQPSAVAFEQRQTEPALEQPQLPAQRRLRDPQSSRGRADAGFLGHRDERVQQPQFYAGCRAMHAGYGK
ncbi:MAG TPA: hypothetical protein VGL21_05890 [Jatrophihabitantaceae bacterium]|jgi:hypothetical protein